MNCYPFIKAERAQRRNVKRACELMKFARSACYAARDGRPSQRAWQCPPTQRAAPWRATPTVRRRLSDVHASRAAAFHENVTGAI